MSRLPDRDSPGYYIVKAQTFGVEALDDDDVAALRQHPLVDRHPLLRELAAQTADRPVGDG